MDDLHSAASLLDAGDGVAAVAIFLKLAERGGVGAMHSLAHTHLYGLAGVQRDYDIAFKWFSKGAQCGCPQAMYHLGICNAHGYGTAKNPSHALEWFQKSAERGDDDAEYHVARCIEQGVGAAPDLDKAIEWYRRAAGHGQSDAAKRLEELGAV